jgi:hypothetical protein
VIQRLFHGFQPGHQCFKQGFHFRC